jgi:2-polyprenyl-3-methyl-5-hydroxy-6-metoxy-1,4-benzoquinol methylase
MTKDMTQMTRLTDSVKENVNRFNDDVRNNGSYAYTASRLSSRFANDRITEAIVGAYDFTGKAVLDLGCGDGAYTLEFPGLGAKTVLGLDPASAAIEAANAKVRDLGLAHAVRFQVGNIYNLDGLLAAQHFDCVVLRGVVHHLPDPAGAIKSLRNFSGTLIVLEPNGLNPIVKLLEKVSRYHREHEERSFAPRLICLWLADNGFAIVSSEMINLVPMFCPDWMAKPLRRIGPLVERLPGIRNVLCGQVLIVGMK